MLNLCAMTHEQAEYEASQAMLDYATSLVIQYTHHPGDVEAATKALFVVCLEQLFDRTIYIEKITR